MSFKFFKIDVNCVENLLLKRAGKIYESSLLIYIGWFVSLRNLKSFGGFMSPRNLKSNGRFVSPRTSTSTSMTPAQIICLERIAFGKNMLSSRFREWIGMLAMMMVVPMLSAQQYIFRSYSVQEGLAQSQVYALLQDSEGYLWAGTRGGGVCKFNGKKFTTYTTQDGLCNNYILSIKEHNNQLWMGTNDGFSIYDKKERVFKNYLQKYMDRPVWVQDFIFIDEQQTLLATSKGVLLKDGDSIVDLFKQCHLTSMVVNAICSYKGNYYFGTQFGLYQLSLQQKKATIHKIENRGFTTVPITTLSVVEHKLWVGTYEHGLYAFHNNQVKPVAELNMSDDIVLSIFKDDKNNVWLSTLNSGICIYNVASRNVSWLNDQSGLPNNHVRSVCQDNSGNYWLATSGSGLCYYMGKEFVHFDRNSGLKGNYIYSIYRDSHNRLWVGNGDKGVSIILGNKVINPFEGKPISQQKIRAITEDSEGNILFGTDGNGIFVLRTQDTLVEDIPIFPELYVRGFAKDLAGSIWVATAGNGIYKISNAPKGRNNWIVQKYSTANGLIQDRISTIITDGDGNIWYGTESNGVGVLDVKGNRLAKIQTVNGLPSDNIKALCFDGKNAVFIGTADNGIARIQTKTYQLTAYKASLSSENCYQLISDGHGNLFAGSEKGVDFLSFSPDNKMKKVKHYGKGEGFLGIETVQNAVFRDVDGTIWFGTINGLEKFNPRDDISNNIPPITKIIDIRLFYTSILNGNYKTYLMDNTSKHVFKPNDNHLTFDFDAINFSNPEGVQFAWRLVGYENKWSPPSGNLSVTYAQIPPGHYVFELKASNEDHVWNKQPVQFYFTISTPFWKTWWFLLLLVATFLAMVFILFKWRVNSIRKKAHEKERQLALEKSIAELEQKALRLQMNPHFIFNALNSIQSLIGTDNEQEARYYLAKFSRLMRQILNNSKTSMISLQEEIQLLDNYLLIEYFCHSKQFDYSIEVDEQIEKDFIQLPPMLLQPFVENSIKHGILHLKNKRGMIQISFKEEDNVLVCTIEDNGIGREASSALQENSKDVHHASTALKVTRERLALLNEPENSIVIEDMQDEQGQPKGTIVTVRLKLN